MKLRLFYVPAGAPFAQALAAWACTQYGAGEGDLPRLRLLLPNRRACRAVREVFLGLSGGKPILLPRIQPLGDWEVEDMPADLLSADILKDLPPSIDPTRRLLMLTKLVMSFEHAMRGEGYSTTQALMLARELARLLDDIAREGLSTNNFEKLVEGELSEHWQHTLHFLKIISQQWPDALAEMGVVDLVERRSRILKAVAATWKHTPPGYPVVAAGSTGTQLATAELLAQIARLPQGALILPGLDVTMPDEDWEALGPTHPQFTLKDLLTRLEVNRKDVACLPGVETMASKRVECLRVALQPATSTAGWSKTSLALAGMQGVKLIEAASPAEEAQTIAVALREVLEQEEKTAALVTPDRELARRVVAAMQRFGVDIDDSAGVPLLDTPPGVFLQLIAECLLSQASPVPLLALLRHPLAAAGLDPEECRNLSRILDEEYLRSVRTASGFAPLLKLVGHAHPELHALLTQLDAHTREFTGWLKRKKPVAAADVLKQHLAIAEWLASTPHDPLGANLWAGDAGSQLAEAIAEILPHLEALPPIDPAIYAAFFETLLAEKVYRPRYGRHPRLHILSPIEARLQHYDRVILGGLNEGTWPAQPAADPWMSRPMRQAFGLPSPERSIGQSAHDFFLLCAMPEVLLTRARKVDGVPTVPSRWLVRLRTLLEGKDPAGWAQLADRKHYDAASQLLDAPVQQPALTRPEPRPPVHARLRGASVTDVEKWQRDPYYIYAKRILSLKPLDPLDQEPSGADFGRLVHRALQLFCERYPQELPDDAEGELLACGKEAFGALLERPAVAALWWPRFEASARWFIATERERRSRGVVVYSECKGSLPINLGSDSFTLTARIDRIEMKDDGKATIVDYKTGTVPSGEEALSQLPMEALLLTEGALERPLGRPVEVEMLEHWRLAGEDGSGAKTFNKKKTVDALIAESRAALEALVKTYADPNQPFAVEADASDLYNEYEHLERRQEWEEA